MSRRSDRAINWTDEELDSMSEVRPEDIEEAAQAWENEAPPNFRTILDAEPENEIRDE